MEIQTPGRAWIFPAVIAWGLVAISREQLSPRLPESMVIFALELFKASAAPEDSKEQKKI